MICNEYVINEIVIVVGQWFIVVFFGLYEIEEIFDVLLVMVEQFNYNYNQYYFSGC